MQGIMTGTPREKPVQTVITLMPPALRTLLDVVPWVAIVSLLLMALALYLEDGDPHGAVGWIIGLGIRPLWIATYSAVSALLLAVLYPRIRMDTLSGLFIYGVLTAPYPLYCLVSSLYIFSTGSGSRVAIVVFWIGYLYFFLILTMVNLIANWIRFHEKAVK